MKKIIENNSTTGSLSNGGGSGTNSAGTTSSFGKTAHLPSLMECEDAEIDDMFDDMLSQQEKVYDFVSGGSTTNGTGGSNSTTSTNNASDTAQTPIYASTGSKRPHTSRMRGAAFVYRSVSSAMDYRLMIGIHTRVETELRRLTLMSSMNLFATFPGAVLPLPRSRAASITAATALPASWPEHVLRSWPDEDYQPTNSTVEMLTEVFDEIFAVMTMQMYTWLNVEQVLQLWLTLNHELADRCAVNNNSNNNPATSAGTIGGSSGGTVSAATFNLCETPKIPFGKAAIVGLLTLLCSQPATSLRTWFLSFQCLIMACNPVVSHLLLASDGDIGVQVQRHSSFIVDDPAFERMLVRFYSSTDNLATTENRNVSVLQLRCVCVNVFFIVPPYSI